MDAPDRYDRVADLVERIFETPSSPRGWHRMLEALSHELSAGAVPILLGRTSRGGVASLLGHGIGLRSLDSESLLPSLDHPSEAVTPVGEIFTIPPASPNFGATHLYRKVLAGEGIAPGPGLCVVLGRDARQIVGALLVLSRDPTWAPTDEDRALLALLAPYLIQGVTAGLQLHERRAGIEALLGVLDALVLGVVLVDEQGDVSFANQSAAELLDIPAGLVPPGAHGNRELLGGAMRALSRAALPGSEQAHALAHPVDGRPLHLVAAPLDWRGMDPGANARFSTALFIGDPASSAADRKNSFAALYGLTPGEERLALKLAAGATLTEAAKALGIQVATVRGVLRSVFAKTDTHRQAALVRLVLTAAGQVRLDPPRG